MTPGVPADGAAVLDGRPSPLLSSDVLQLRDGLQPHDAVRTLLRCCCYTVTHRGPARVGTGIAGEAQRGCGVREHACQPGDGRARGAGSSGGGAHFATYTERPIISSHMITPKAYTSLLRCSW